VVDEVLIRIILRNTRFQPSANLKVYDSYIIDMGSKTAYIHEDVMVRLGLLDADNDIIETETKSGKRTVANVLKLRHVDKQRDNIIRLGTMLKINLGLE
jgi:hypothetical protein